MSQESTGGSSFGPGAGGGSEAQGTLAMLLKHCRSSQEGKAFLYDELALSAGSGALSSDALDTLIEMLGGELVLCAGLFLFLVFFFEHSSVLCMRVAENAW